MNTAKRARGKLGPQSPVSVPNSKKMMLECRLPSYVPSAGGVVRGSSKKFMLPEPIMPTEYEISDSAFPSSSISKLSFQETVDEIWESCRRQLEDKEILVLQKEADKSQRVLGLLAYEVEKGIACKVLDSIAGEDHFVYSVEGLELAIEGIHRHYRDVLEDEKQRKGATEAWESLKKDLSWSDELHRFILRLELSYDSCVDLTITDSAVREAMKNESSRDQSLIYKLLDIHHNLYHH